MSIKTNGGERRKTLTTKQVYEYLTEAHGISRQLCKHCFNRDVEVFQCDFTGCYNCWCELVDPKIEIRD